MLNNDLKTWKVEVFGNVVSQKRSFLQELRGLEGRKKIGALSDVAFFREKKKQIASYLEKVILMEEI